MSKLSSIRIALSASYLVLVLSSCVAREQFDDSEDRAKHFQKQALEADRQMGELLLENSRLKEMLRASEANPVDASSNMEAIDKRLSELKNKLAEFGTNPGDVTKYAVDGGNLYQVKDAILFTLGSASLSPEGQKVLEAVARDIDSSPHGQVSVRGHTDNVPVSKPETKAKFPHGNLQLSAERAVEVAVALRGMHAAVNDLVVMGFGDSQPVLPNTSAENRQRNRRVEIFVADPTPAQK